MSLSAFYVPAFSICFVKSDCVSQFRNCDFVFFFKYNLRTTHYLVIHCASFCYIVYFGLLCSRASWPMLNQYTSSFSVLAFWLYTTNASRTSLFIVAPFTRKDPYYFCIYAHQQRHDSLCFPFKLYRLRRHASKTRLACQHLNCLIWLIFLCFYSTIR